MKVSIITAVRNAAATVGATLRSAASQTHEDIEHIVIDGASTDETLSEIRRYGERVTRVVSEPDSGVYDAFNKGLALATGDAIGFLNAGDQYVDASVIRDVADSLGRHAVDAVFGDVEIVSPVPPHRILRRYRSGSFEPKRVGLGFMPAHPALYLRRTAYERYGVYDSSFRIAGDFELVARLFCRHGVSFQYLPRTMVRMMTGGLSNSGIRSSWIITREMQRACRQNGVDTNFLKLSLRLPIKLREMVYW